jgi:predicted  nucleic acid-binding Zn-ribbon protein
VAVDQALQLAQFAVAAEQRTGGLGHVAFVHGRGWCRGCCGCGSRTFGLQRQREAVAAAGDRGDGAVAEQLAQREHLHLQVVLFHHERGPHEVHQLVFRHHPIVALHEGHQHVERAAAELDRVRFIAAFEQQAPVRQQPVVVEAVAGVG